LDLRAILRSILRGDLVRPARRGATKIEFLLYGSPDDAFYSQIAFFRLSLDHLGDEGRAARVVAVFAAVERSPLPERWALCFERIEIHYVDGDAFRRRLPASDQRFDLLSSDADCSCLCDADTVLVRRVSCGPKALRRSISTSAEDSVDRCPSRWRRRSDRPRPRRTNMPTRSCRR
jgi:hypothetical protein